MQRLSFLNFPAASEHIIACPEVYARKQLKMFIPVYFRPGKSSGEYPLKLEGGTTVPFFNQLVSFIKFGNSAIGHLVAARFTDKADGISIRMQQGILTFKCPFLNSLQLPLHVYMHYLQRGGQDYIVRSPPCTIIVLVNITPDGKNSIRFFNSGKNTIASVPGCNENNIHTLVNQCVGNGLRRGLIIKLPT